MDAARHHAESSALSHAQAACGGRDTTAEKGVL